MISARFYKPCHLLFQDSGIKGTLMLDQLLTSWGQEYT